MMVLTQHSKTKQQTSSSVSIFVI